MLSVIEAFPCKELSSQLRLIWLPDCAEAVTFWKPVRSPFVIRILLYTREGTSAVTCKASLMVYEAAILTLDLEPLPDPKYRDWIFLSGCRKLITNLNLFCCKSCFSLGGLLLGFGMLRIMSCPRQLAPTMVPTFPENPPRIPFIILAIFLCFFMIRETKVTQKTTCWSNLKSFGCICLQMTCFVCIGSDCFECSSGMMRVFFGKKMFFPKVDWRMILRQAQHDSVRILTDLDFKVANEIKLLEYFYESDDFSFGNNRIKRMRRDPSTRSG